MAKTVGFRYAIEWANPYTSPNGEKVLLEIFETLEQREKRGGGIPQEVIDYYKSNVGYGSGYAVTFKAITMPHKPLDTDMLGKIRRKRLERRMRSKYPLFADMLIREEIENRADYYQGVTDREIEKKKQARLDDELAEYQRFEEYVKNPAGECSRMLKAL